MGLNAGNLDREIVLQTATKTQNPRTGEEVIDWTLVSETIWAQWLPAGTKEAWQAQERLQGYVEGVFRIYWRDDVTPDGSRIVWDGKTYDVKPTIEGRRQEWLDVPVVAHA